MDTLKTTIRCKEKVQKLYIFFATLPTRFIKVITITSAKEAYVACDRSRECIATDNGSFKFSNVT